MKSRCPARSEILILIVGLGLLGPAGCGGGAPGVAAPKFPSDAARKAIELYDVDKHGYLDAKELEKAPAIRAAFPGSSKVTEEDIAARLAKWKENGLGRLAFQISVKHNGKPLPDATVTLVPESFLGSAIETAVGKTDRAGCAMATIPAHGSDHRPGVAPGFYRVEITKTGENIPATYNTATTLGGEVPDTNEGGWIFDLKY